MKIAILGYSGSGKSTLAQKLAEVHDADALHLDSVHFLPGWKIRNDEDKRRMVKEFLDTHESWIIDGNYSKLHYERRMAEADKIILLLFNRFSCLKRAYGRYRKYRNTTRPDMAEGCNEKFDTEFAKWILWKGRSPESKKSYSKVISQYHDKIIVIKNQKQLSNYIKTIG